MKKSVSQSILLFLAGFENMSRSLAFTLHCFATHQHSQDKARQDIKDRLRDEKVCEGAVSSHHVVQKSLSVKSISLLQHVLVNLTTLL